MGPLGVPELIFILVIALLIFGPKRLPEFGRTIGKALGEFRRASTDLRRSINVELSAADEPEVAPTQPPAPAAARSRPEVAVEEDAEEPAQREGEETEAESEETEDQSEEPADGSVN